MKKLLILSLVTLLLLSGCTSNESKDPSDKTEGSKSIEVTGNGYGGELVLSVTVNGETIENIEVVESNETSNVFDRAFPVIKDRIIAEQSPIVDNVSGATFSSYAVKKAVADAMLEQGKDFGTISMDTAKERGEKVALENAETQLVVVGGGSAGLSAAIAAKENGVENVILIEKLDILSGNGKFDMNFFDLINSEAMIANDNIVTVDDFIASKSTSTDSPERIATWAQGSYELDAWLRTMDINLNNNSGGTNHMAEADEYSGNHIQYGLEKRAAELGVDIRTGHKGTDLIVVDGVVVGVNVETIDGFYDIMADATVMATGGFSHNPEYLAEYAPGSEMVATSNSMGATGDFVKVFEGLDYQMANMDVLSVFKLIIKNRRDLTGAGDGFVLVNENAERFVAENKSGLDMAHAILEQPNGKVIYIYDQFLYESAYRLQKHNNLGYHTKADSLEDLAVAMGLDADALVNTIEEFNSAIAGDTTDEFREEAFTRAFDTTGPVYAVQVESAIHMTKGGVVANENAQVINNANEIVSGLYAAGEVTATSGAYSASVVWGKIAGEQVALEILAK